MVIAMTREYPLVSHWPVVMERERSRVMGGSAVVSAVASMELAMQLITILRKIRVRVRSEREEVVMGLSSISAVLLERRGYSSTMWPNPTTLCFLSLCPSTLLVKRASGHPTAVPEKGRQAETPARQSIPGFQW